MNTAAAKQTVLAGIARGWIHPPAPPAHTEPMTSAEYQRARRANRRAAGLTSRGTPLKNNYPVTRKHRSADFQSAVSQVSNLPTYYPRHD